MSTPQTRPPGIEPPPDHDIKVPVAVVNGAQSDYRAGYKEGWAAAAKAYTEGEDPYAPILEKRTGDPKYGGEPLQVARVWEEALTAVVKFALSRILAAPVSDRRDELQRSLVLKLRNLANNISPPE